MSELIKVKNHYLLNIKRPNALHLAFGSRVSNNLQSLVTEAAANSPEKPISPEVIIESVSIGQFSSATH